MMKSISAYVFCLIASIAIAACTSSKKIDGLIPYKPVSQELHDEIVRMDSILFHSYNTCDTVTYASIFSEDLEFYHDGGGLEKNKQKSIDAYKKYVCGKVTRELLKGSIEVSPVPNYGAVEIGMHRFHNSQEPNAFSKYARFVIVWKKENSTWKVTRVISLH
jgi:hypothetical protein